MARPETTLCGGPHTQLRDHALKPLVQQPVQQAALLPVCGVPCRYWLHPQRFKTELCQFRTNCHRPVCFFGHSADELRVSWLTNLPHDCCISAASDKSLPAPLSSAYVSLPASLCVLRQGMAYWTGLLW
jgi:hypothetical protein